MAEPPSTHNLLVIVAIVDTMASRIVNDHGGGLVV